MLPTVGAVPSVTVNPFDVPESAFKFASYTIIRIFPWVAADTAVPGILHGYDHEVPDENELSLTSVNVLPLSLLYLITNRVTPTLSVAPHATLCDDPLAQLSPPTGEVIAPITGLTASGFTYSSAPISHGALRA
jgi:hypothetical protein